MTGWQPFDTSGGDLATENSEVSVLALVMGVGAKGCLGSAGHSSEILILNHHLMGPCRHGVAVASAICS